MQKILARKDKVPNWYLDLSMVGKYWGAERTYHHTAPINMVYALREALALVSEEGLENRWNRHKQVAALLWKGLNEIAGLECFVLESNRLPSLCSVRVPQGVDAKKVCRYLLEKYNIEIGGGLGELAGKIWRIGLMGFNSRAENVLLCIHALKEAVQSPSCKSE
jgi:alanine-glyoxylate transaminase/serine-glyoxylate transaminase/serine-pyruvate transaminase